MSCPICGGEFALDYRPFCSKRCADIDLARWLNEGYVLPDAALAGPVGDTASGGSENRQLAGKSLWTPRNRSPRKRPPEA